MHLIARFALLLFVFLTACDTREHSTINMQGNFAVGDDLFLAHFDSKTDVDDIQSIAAVSTMLRDARLAGVEYHAVAGAYGTQGGLYIPANELFDAAFGDNWSDAHDNFERAVREVSDRTARTIRRGGDIWIAEAGQSDFTAALIREVSRELSGLRTADRFHVVQHSEWNEGSTHPDNLSFVRNNTTYVKIPDGNAVGNGSPGFATNNEIDWRSYLSDTGVIDLWEMAIQISDHFNGRDNRYTNQFIASGGMDFSDVSETCFIFGFEHLRDTNAFFEEFGVTQ